MKSIPPVPRLAAALAAAVLVSACGGGGGSSGPSTPPPSNPPPTQQPDPVPPPQPPAGCQVQVVADSSVQQGKMASASVLSCGAPLGEVVWSQVSGPSVNLLAQRSPTAAFEPNAAGTVTLRADVTLADGSKTSSTANVEVTARPAGSYITVRADHALRPEQNTSVRAWPNLNSGETVTRIAWTQTAGPTVTMDTTDQNVLMFKTPAATADTALRFRATLTTSSGRTDSDDVTVVIDRETRAATNLIFEDGTARVHPYRQAARYAPVLVRCTYNAGIYYNSASDNNFCKTETLPLLRTEAGDGNVPSVEQIMGRVVVSHDFLGANFEQFLLTQDPHGDFRRLLGNVTAIVIGSHVRPSFYTAATGAIYLDAAYLWLTPEQRDVVTEVPDYRLAFDDALNFSTVGRLVRNGDYAQRFIGDDERVSRTSEQHVLGLGRLLYHELAHAGDFMPPATDSVFGSLSVWGNIVPRLNLRVLPSDILAERYPLTSAEMKGLGQVMYLGATPTAEQKAYTAEQVGQFFASDVASDDYAYSINEGSSSREDLAMLFEEFMMVYRHNVRYDVAYTNKLMDGMNSDQLIVGWGERGRIAEPAIKPRVKLVVERIAPWIGAAAVDTLPPPVLLPRGQTWVQTVTVAGQKPGVFSGSSAMRVESGGAREERRRDALRRGHRHAH